MPLNSYFININNEINVDTKNEFNLKKGDNYFKINKLEIIN
jgi:hypothetical protein